MRRREILHTFAYAPVIAGVGANWNSDVETPETWKRFQQGETVSEEKLVESGFSWDRIENLKRKGLAYCPRTNFIKRI